MDSIKSFVLIKNIKLPVNASVSEAFSVAKRTLKRVGLQSYAEEYSIFRRSVDARRKPDIFYVYTVAVRGDFPKFSEEQGIRLGISLHTPVSMESALIGDTPLSAPPVVVGSGPCGLFAALLLAEWGYKPIILERGGSVKDRHAQQMRFERKHILDTDTNIQFGAGGVGTFSDGKLVTRINDPLTSYVLERFIEFGAPEEIRYIAKPHVGTDVLSVVVDRMIDRITELGGSILYHTKYLSPIVSGGRVSAVLTSKGEIPCGALILAIGHSARDTYENIIRSDLSVEAKSFSVGMRIEHLAEDIDYALYGEAAGTEGLGHAEYALSHDTKNRGTYTFCMCPGGIVVAAASEEGGTVVNGMSYHSRSEKNSNSAVVTTVFREDYGSDPLSAIEFQRKIERAAFGAGGGGYAAPIITVGDFLAGKCGTSPSRITPSYMSGSNVKLANPESFLPNFVCSGIRSALVDFDRKISGFATPDAILTGAETRTSAPLRILRDKDTRTAIGYENIYPAGEGAGYAGGITSAAIDGIKSALALMKNYSNK
ncbi:MAG: hypothetical protein IKJ25_07055 [Clostridia bacterium]|nr:hypothetical protein [Clostridia bacterium]